MNMILKHKYERCYFTTTTSGHTSKCIQKGKVKKVKKWKLNKLILVSAKNIFLHYILCWIYIVEKRGNLFSFSTLLGPSLAQHTLVWVLQFIYFAKWIASGGCQSLSHVSTSHCSRHNRWKYHHGLHHENCCNYQHRH